GDRSRRDELSAHLRHVADSVLPTPVDELLDKLVELRSAQDVHRDWPRQQRLLVRGLRRVVSGRESVAPDDRYDDNPAYSRSRTRLLQVPCCGREEVGRRLLVGRRPGRRVDDAFDTGQGARQAVAADYVDAA